MEGSQRTIAAARATAQAAKGPVALILCEDAVEAGSTVAHHRARGFGAVMVFAPPALHLPDLPAETPRFDWDTAAPEAYVALVNAFAGSLPDRWIYAGFNAEYLFHPFSGARSVGEFLAHVAEERRPAVMGILADLYAGDLEAHPDGVDRAAPLLDGAGYYSEDLPRGAGISDPPPQIAVYGGLRWRFEEHVPLPRRRIDRVALFRGKRGLRMTSDRRFDDPVYNSISAPWHHSATACIASFRAAKALLRNPESRGEVKSFRWSRSLPFDWSDQQLMDLGLMEPGQWF